MEKISLGPSTLVYPMPAFLVGANVNGKPNVLTVAWGGIACGTPPMVSLAIHHKRHTMKGIQETGTFSVNVPSRDIIEQTDYCGIVSGAKTDKISRCGFSVFYGKLLTAPMIMQCPINLECRLTQILDLGSHLLVVGEVIDTFASEECLTDGRPDVNKIEPLVYSSGAASSYHTLGTSLAPAFRIGKNLKGVV